jgi:hypothetical protein
MHTEQTADNLSVDQDGGVWSASERTLIRLPSTLSSRRRSDAVPAPPRPAPLRKREHPVRVHRVPDGSQHGPLGLLRREVRVAQGALGGRERVQEVLTRCARRCSRTTE